MTAWPPVAMNASSLDRSGGFSGHVSVAAARFDGATMTRYRVDVSFAERPRGRNVWVV